MPKVLRIITRLNIGGPMYNVSYLSKYLAPEYETILLSGMTDASEGTTEFLMENFGLEPEFVPDMFRDVKLMNDAKALQQVRKVIRRFKPDIVHTHTTKAGAIGRFAAHLEKVPIIVHTFHGNYFHSYFSKRKIEVFKKIERYLAKRTSKIIAISNLQREELSQKVGLAPMDKFEVVPLGFELDKFQEDKEAKRQAFRTKYQIADDEVAIGIVGRLVPIKNHAFFIKAIKRLSQITNQKFKVLIIGDGEERENILQLCQQEKLSYSIHTDEKHDKTIVFTSWIMEMDVAMAGLDIVTLTSLNEGTPVSLIEASAAGKPIVSTNVGGILDVVKKDINAFILDKTDYNGFADKLKLLVDDSALRTKMGTEGVNHAFENYSHTALVNNVRNLYERLMQEKGMK